MDTGKASIVGGGPMGSATTVQQSFRPAKPVAGSIMNSDDVPRAVAGSDAAFLMTPLGLNNDPSGKIEAAKTALSGIKEAGREHLICSSCLGVDRIQGIGIPDAKHEMEKLNRDSGSPSSILRCGTNIQDLFDPRINLLNRGKFLLPLNKDWRFTFTSRRDAPRFIARELLGTDRASNRAMDLVVPGTFSISDNEGLPGYTARFRIEAPAPFPTFHFFRALLPLCRLRKDRLPSVIPLLSHFDRHGHTSSAHSSRGRCQNFRTTSLSEHLAGLWSEQSHATAARKRKMAAPSLAPASSRQRTKTAASINRKK